MHDLPSGKNAKGKKRLRSMGKNKRSPGRTKGFLGN